jgi:hypothetical protein
MKKTSVSGVLVGLLILPTISNAICHQECIPAGPWTSACPICNYDTRTPPGCAHHISEHSGCTVSGICPLERHPIFGAPPGLPDSYSYTNYVPDCVDSSPSC